MTLSYISRRAGCAEKVPVRFGKGGCETYHSNMAKRMAPTSLCGESGVVLQVHHVIWKDKGGSDTPENLLTLCEKCHKRVHQNPKTNTKVKELFAGLCKRYVHTTLLNSIMPQFYEWLLSRFEKVSVTYGFETKEKRRNLGCKKGHVIDAYLISWQREDKIPTPDCDEVVVYEYRQVRRHHRQLIHATRERNYKYGKTIVAQNRNQRTGQQSDSLADFVKKKGKKVLAELRILPGKKVIRSGFDEFRKGDVVRYNGACYVVKRYGQMGRTLGLFGLDEYVLAKDCSLIIRNTGMVCL